MSARDMINGLTLLEEVFGECDFYAEHEEVWSGPIDNKTISFEVDLIKIEDEYKEKQEYPTPLTKHQAKLLAGWGWTWDGESFHKYT